MLDAAYILGRPIFGGDFYSKKYGTYAIVSFFLPTFRENFKFLKSCPYDFHKIFQSFFTQKGPCMSKGIRIVWLECEKHSQN